MSVYQGAVSLSNAHAGKAVGSVTLRMMVGLGLKLEMHFKLSADSSESA